MLLGDVMGFYHEEHEGLEGIAYNVFCIRHYFLQAAACALPFSIFMFFMVNYMRYCAGAA